MGSIRVKDVIVVYVYMYMSVSEVEYVCVNTYTIKCMYITVLFITFILYNHYI